MRAWMRSNPCFYLFSALLLLLVLLPAVQNSPAGHLVFVATIFLVLIASAVALGRSRVSFLAALFLGGPGLVLLLASHFTGDTRYLVWTWCFSTAFLVSTLVHLVRYVLQPAGPEGITADRLYGGAATYLLLGLLWCYFYVLAEHFSPGSFSGLGSHKALHIADMIFLSFGSLTTAGSLDVVPHERLAKTLVILEEVVGTLYIGAFVARLVAVYSSGRR